MTDSLHKYMKVGLVHFMAFPETMRGEGPIVETVRKVALDDYFDVIEITTIKNADDKQKVKKILESSHMTVTYGGQPRLLTNGLNLNALDEKSRLAALSNMKEAVDEAYEMGAVGLSFLAGNYTEEKKEDAFNALVQSTNEICSYATSKGNMKIALEVFDYDVDKKSLIGPAALALRYAKEVRKQHQNFGLMVDLSHIPLIHETIEESLVPVKDYITHAHIGNCVVKQKGLPAYGDVHPRFGFPDSENDVDEVAHYLRVLLDIGYLNERKPQIVSFEVKPFGDEDAEIVIANAKRTLNRAWAMV